jgi:small acid-soluble spore protein H (minor)
MDYDRLLGTLIPYPHETEGLLIMNVGRAKQIVDSSKEFTVLHNGVPVWIQHIDEGDGTARVYTRQNPDDEKVVPVGELEEQQNM